MGREIRMVPPKWEHPIEDGRHGKSFVPLHNSGYAEAAREWKEGFAAWERGERPDYCGAESQKLEFWEYDGQPPEREHYRPEWAEGEATWFQVYETVSEGTPITPPFATKEELVEWLCTHKDFWNKGPLTREQAQAFVEDGWAPSMMMVSGAAGTEIICGMEIPAAARKP